MKSQHRFIPAALDWTVLLTYFILVIIGVTCIFMVEYKIDSDIFQSFISLKTNYSRQTLFAIVAIILGMIILYADAKFFADFTIAAYTAGILLLLLTLVIAPNIGGSRSWLPLGFVKVQPIEFCKIFTALALAKYIAQLEHSFSSKKSYLMAMGIVFLPAIISILQNETGIAIVYIGFLIPMYREGLSPFVLLIAIGLAVLGIATIAIDPDILVIIITAIAVITILIIRKKYKHALYIILGIWLFCVVLQRFAVPYIFNNIFQCHQSTRIYAMLGQEYDCSKNSSSSREAKVAKGKKKDINYNVRQSKIAIGAGGFIGKGFLNGTQTRGKYVPQQHTDFIFTSLAEAFGLVGCAVFLGIFLFFVFRLLNIAERQRSIFARVYGYSVASIFAIHIFINIAMTVGLFPVVGIPLPFISYGGSSLISFTLMLFILLRLDTERKQIFR